MHRDANLNMIRNWVGQSTSEQFYELCDQYASMRCKGMRFMASSSPQSPPRIKMGTPFTTNPRLLVPAMAYVIFRTPNEVSV